MTPWLDKWQKPSILWADEWHINHQISHNGFFSVHISLYCPAPSTPIVFSAKPLELFRTGAVQIIAVIIIIITFHASKSPFKIVDGISCHDYDPKRQQFGHYISSAHSSLRQHSKVHSPVRFCMCNTSHTSTSELGKILHMKHFFIHIHQKTFHLILSTGRRHIFLCHHRKCHLLICFLT